MEEFNLGNNEFIELNNLLKVMGLCDSGGIAKTVIADGRVRVIGVIFIKFLHDICSRRFHRGKEDGPKNT